MTKFKAGVRVYVQSGNLGRLKGNVVLADPYSAKDCQWYWIRVDGDEEPYPWPEGDITIYRKPMENK